MNQHVAKATVSMLLLWRGTVKLEQRERRGLA
jgi:hypothetical protein